MHRREFIELVSAMLEDCEIEMRKKSADYQQDHDVFLNLENEGKQVSTPVPRLLWIYMNKHLTAVRKHCLDQEVLVSESLVSRLTDIINYCVLIYAYQANSEYSSMDIDEPIAPKQPHSMMKSHNETTQFSQEHIEKCREKGISPHPSTTPRSGT